MTVADASSPPEEPACQRNLNGHLKTGHTWTVQNRPYMRAPVRSTTFFGRPARLQLSYEHTSHIQEVSSQPAARQAPRLCLFRPGNAGPSGSRSRRFSSRVGSPPPCAVSCTGADARYNSFVRSARIQFPLIRRNHISAFNRCMSQFRKRVSQSTDSLKGYGRFRAYPCVDE